ncbi:MAG: hypothetical protein SGILL_003029, partial [Bacillariaceae sp.]
RAHTAQAFGAQSFGAQSSANFLAEAVPFGSCPALPENRVPDLDDNAANDGWKLVDFCINVGANGGAHDLAVAPDCHNNDDDSSVQSLMFDFKLFGNTYDEVYINTNGHFTFGSFYSQFTPSGIPFAGVEMIAPFWADVDIGNIGYIWQKEIGANTFAVAWDHVGYYDEKTDLVNTFSVMISDGTNPDFGLNNEVTDEGPAYNNVCFCYHEMEWTTGDVSGGVGGLGGTASTIGVNSNTGNGTDWLDVGGFNGPDVSSLDGTESCFYIPPNGENVKPVPTGLPANNEIIVECNSTVMDMIGFAAPEADQTTSVAVTAGGVDPGLTVTLTQGGQEAFAQIDWTPVGTSPYIVPIEFTATDAPPMESTTVTLMLSYLGCDDGTGGGGDPHFTTWNGDKFDFHGECDLVLVRNPDFADGLGMHIHGRTKIHHDWSAFESSAIRIGDDVFEVKGKTHWFNGEENAELPVFVGGYRVDRPTESEHAARYVVHLGDGERIIMKSYDEFLWVEVEGPKSKDFAKTAGLLGAFGGEKFARNGLTQMTDTNAFGQEWQVRYDVDPQLFHSRVGPQWPTKCTMPEAPKPEGRVARHLRMSMAKEACANVNKAVFDDCVADVVATNDAGLASAY